MASFNPNIHHRRSIRLKGYDYAQAGLYFITICVQKRACLFGKITDGQMILNDAGKMIEKWYTALETKFPDIKCHEMIVMPNHFHCIVENVGADPRVCPNTGDEHVPADPRVCPNIGDEQNENWKYHDIGGEHVGDEHAVVGGEHVGSPLHRVVQWFKTMTTNEYIRGVKTLDWQRFDGKLWQRNYYEHIIRNEQSYQRISEYIINNPAKWAEDKFHKG